MNSSLREIIVQYFNIAFLMNKPQDLPAGVQQMYLGVGFALATYVLALMTPYGFSRAFMHASIDLAATGVLFFISLTILGRRARFEQAFGGICGASAFINLAAVPLNNLQPLAEGAETESSVTRLAFFVLLVWGISLLGHVVRHTFEVKMRTSILISFFYFIILTSLLAALMPMQ